MSEIIEGGIDVTASPPNPQLTTAHDQFRVVPFDTHYDRRSQFVIRDAIQRINNRKRCWTARHILEFGLVTARGLKGFEKLRSSLNSLVFGIRVGQRAHEFSPRITGRYFGEIRSSNTRFVCACASSR